tara:strand:- start:136 stop:1221 length:1086 start_codon:yes stop_codon:yes gene_type:complete
LRINLFEPTISKSEEKKILQVLRSKFWASGSGTGTVGIFEKKFNQYIGSKDSLAVNSGTSALNIALSLINLKGKEVLIPSLSFVSTANCVLRNGGKPVFVDVNSNDLSIDTTLLEEKINSKTAVILPVHFGGLPAQLDTLTKICKKHNLLLIEDAAHASGATFKNKKVGTHGFAVCFSFHPVKNLSMPTGGMITLNTKDHQKLRTRIESLRWCGISNRKNDYYEINELGDNYYMNEISAAIGIEQLKKLDRLNKRRKIIAKTYHTELKIEEKMPYDENSSYHLFWIRNKNRENLRKYLHSVGIQTGIHYLPIHKFNLYKTKEKLPVTESVGNEIITLPMHANLSNSQVDKIISHVNKFLNK